MLVHEIIGIRKSNRVDYIVNYKIDLKKWYVTKNLKPKNDRSGDLEGKIW